MNVHSKLMRARVLLQGKKLTKTGLNKFAGYQYFELGDFLPTVQEIFSELYLCGVVSFTADVATLTIVDAATEGQIVITSPMGSAALKGCHEVQNIGAVETYQRRYLWTAAMEIVEHDALDATTGKAKGAMKHSPTQDAVVEDERRGVIVDTAESIKCHFEVDDVIGAYEDASGITDPEEKIALWRLLPSNIRSALKKHAETLKEAVV